MQCAVLSPLPRSFHCLVLGGKAGESWAFLKGKVQFQAQIQSPENISNLIMISSITQRANASTMIFCQTQTSQVFGQDISDPLLPIGVV